MAVKTLTITTTAYDSLAALKREGESFSELVCRLTQSQTLLTPFAGAWKDAPKRELDEVRRFLRDGDRLSQAKLRRIAREVDRLGKPG